MVLADVGPSRTFPIVLAGFTAFLDLYATQPLLPLLMRVFSATHFAVSLTITASTVAVAVAAPAVGRLADLVGRKRVIVASAFLLAVATLLAATADSLPQLVAWRFLQGLATPGVFATTIAYIHDEWPPSHVGRATAAYISGTVTGGFCGRALVGLLASRVTWQTAFVCLAVVNVAAAFALAAWLPREVVPRSAPGGGGHRRSAIRLLSNRQLVATDLVGFCVLFSQVAMFTYVTFHLSGPRYGLGTAALGWLFVVYLVGAAVTPLAGRWIDARGHRAGLASGVAIGIVGAVLTLGASLTSIVAGLALVATGVFISQATASSYIGAVTREDRGLAVGLYSTFYYLGGSLGAALPAVFWARGGWGASVALVIVVQVITAFLALTFWGAADVGSRAVPETGLE
ncbi:MAG: MFS transporter [Luteitalea sp.]|nr:MFS transporter [Luteitalea sp.]